MAQADSTPMAMARVEGSRQAAVDEFAASDTQVDPVRVVSWTRLTDRVGVHVWEPAATLPGSARVEPDTRSVSR